MAVVLGQDLDVRPRLLDPRRADEDAAQRLRLALDVEVGLEAVHLPAPRVPRDLEVDEPEVVPVEHDHPGARAEIGAAELAHRLVEPVEPHQPHERRRLAARNHEPVEPVELLRLAHLDDVRAERRSIAACSRKLPWTASTPTRGGTTSLGSRAALRERATPRRGRSSRRRDPARRARGPPRRSKCVVASTIAFARASGFVGLEDARADEHAVRAELHAERRVGRRRDAAGGERHDGQPAVLGDPAARARTARAAPSPRRTAPPRAATAAAGCARTPRACA